MEFSLKNLKLFRIITETKKIIVEIELLDVKWNEFEETFVTIKFLERFYKLLKIIIFKVRLCFIILGMGGNMIELELKKKLFD